MWYWHEAYVEVDWDCDFEAAGLKTAFDGLELDSLPVYDENGDPMGDNNCWSIHHYDDDSNKEINDQKYITNGKEYTVRPCNVLVGPGYAPRIHRAMEALN